MSVFFTYVTQLFIITILLFSVLRMGRFLDTLYTASRMINHEDVLISFNSAMSKISYALYLLCDHIIWFGRQGFADTDATKWNQMANKCWLFTIIMNLTRDYCEIKRLLSNDEILKFKYNDPKFILRNCRVLADEHKDVILDTIKNSCDIFLPLAALNYIKLNPGTIGLLGVISSVIGIYTVVDPFAKLSLS